MASSIDPVDNIFGTGVSLFQRILIGFAAGWAGNFLSRFCASMKSWESVKQPIGLLTDMVSEFGSFEAVAFALWPVVCIYYLAKVPIYALILIPIILLAVIRIVFTDDPVLFWTLLLVFALAPGMVLSDGNAWSLIPLAFVMFGLGAGIWWALQYEHGHWIDEVKSWFEKDGT